MADALQDTEQHSCPPPIRGQQHPHRQLVMIKDFSRRCQVSFGGQNRPFQEALPGPSVLKHPSVLALGSPHPQNFMIELHMNEAGDFYLAPGVKHKMIQTAQGLKSFEIILVIF